MLWKTGFDMIESLRCSLPAVPHYAEVLSSSDCKTASFKGTELDLRQAIVEATISASTRTPSHDTKPISHATHRAALKRCVENGKRAFLAELGPPWRVHEAGV